MAFEIRRLMERVAKDRQRIAPSALFAVLICLVLFSGGAFQRLVAPDMDVEGNVILRLMWLPVYALVIGLVLTQAKDVLRLAWRLPAIMVLLALAVLSSLWSIDPGVSLRRGIGLIATTLFGLYLATRFDWRRLLMILGAVWLGLALINVLAGLAAPDFARDFEIHIGAWRGFWFEKNTMGGHMARASLIFGVLLLVDAKRRLTWSLGLGLSVLLVLLSTSTTALLATVLGLGVLAGGWVMQGRPVMAVVGVWSGVALAGGFATFVALQPEVFLGLFGKDASLTGRTDIWSALVDAITARPLLGYGYGAFWGLDSEPAYWVREAVSWDAPTAHNGWLEITLGLGLAGLVVFAISFVATFGRAFLQVFDHRFALYAFGFLAQIALFSVSESLLLELNSIVWINYVAVAGVLVLGVSQEGSVQRPPRKSVSRLRLRRDPPGLI
ncbi:MAG: O-antigen ligase [Pseudomonadota bacterium]